MTRPIPRVTQAAVAIELTHLATLFHDDVMDEALVRRGHPSANSRWDNSVAILTGDFLFAQASQILARLGPEAVRIQAETFSRLVTGQTSETIGPRPGQDPLDHYMHVITEKTGSLIATSGRFGALFSGAPGGSRRPDRRGLREARRGLAAIGRRASTSPATRPSRARPRVPTCARASARCRCSTRCARSASQAQPPAGTGQSAADARLRWLLEDADLADEALLTEALTLLRGHHAMKESRADVLNWVHEARTSIKALPDGPARAAFLAMCDFVEKRTG